MDVCLPKLIHTHLIQRRLKSHMEVRAAVEYKITQSDFKIIPSEMEVAPTEAISHMGWIILLHGTSASISADINLSLKVLPFLGKVEKGHCSHFCLVSSAESCSCCRWPRSFSLEKQPATPCQVIDLQLVVDILKCVAEPVVGIFSNVWFGFWAGSEVVGLPDSLGSNVKVDFASFYQRQFLRHENVRGHCCCQKSDFPSTQEIQLHM